MSHTWKVGGCMKFLARYGSFHAAWKLPALSDARTVGTKPDRPAAGSNGGAMSDVPLQAASCSARLCSVSESSIETTYSTCPFSPTPTTSSSMRHTRETAGRSVLTYGSARKTHLST